MEKRAVRSLKVTKCDWSGSTVTSQFFVWNVVHTHLVRSMDQDF